MSVKLSSADEQLLEGARGEAAQMAMRIVVRMADVLGADSRQDFTGERRARHARLAQLMEMLGG